MFCCVGAGPGRVPGRVVVAVDVFVASSVGLFALSATCLFVVIRVFCFGLGLLLLPVAGSLLGW